MALESVFGGLVGLGGSLAPAVLEFFNKKQERKHAETLRQQDVEMAKLGHAFELQRTELTADATETSSVYTHDQSLSEGAGPFWSAVRASVRPVLTYAFFALFVVIKLAGLYTAWWIQNTPLVPALQALWDPNTEALFAATMAFWFGQRAIGKLGYLPATPKVILSPKASRNSK